ncbi:Fc.00g100390.m01.CDS01 [Cosmosporella sp. VM-42]
MPSSELAPFTTVFRAADSHRVKRNRQPVSCTACQRRKSKCDRQKPCAACEKRGDAAACRFGPAAGGSAGRQEVHARLAKLEEMVKGLASSGKLETTTEVGVGKANAGDVVGTGGTGDGTDASYHGATSWAALVDSIRDIQNVLENEDDLSPPEPPPSQEPDVVLGDIPPITLKEIMSSLPSRADTDELVMIYWRAKFLAAPFIHLHHFRRRYEAFWDNPSRASFLWISSMFSIISNGAMIAKVKPGSFLDSVREPRFYLRKAAQCLITGQYLQAKPFSVEALMMFAHSRNIQKQDSDSTIWSLYGLSIRLAQRRGYHLDAAKVSPHITPFEAEMRRRTWFMIQSSDLLFSFQLGMPPMIYQEVCDADHPRNLTDDDFDENTPVPPSRPPTDPMPMLAWRTKSFLCRILRRVLRHALAVVTPPYSDTMALNDELVEFYASVPASLQIRPIRLTSWSEEAYTIMHRLILELMYRKTVIVLHRRYLSLKKDDAKYNVSREICRDAAMRILNLHLEFDHEIRPGGRMYNDRFMVSSLTLHDFLVAAMVICLDLSESVDVSPEDRAHRIQVLQSAHSIWTERGAHSQDALHASKVLRAILNKVETPTGASSASSTLVPETPSTGETFGSGQLEPPDMTPMQLTDFPVNFDEMPPVDSFFGGHELDWNSIDHYLRMGYSNESPSNQPFPDIAP